MSDNELLTVEYFALAAALGRALEYDSPEFWEVVVELKKVFPQYDWHNAMTDSAAKGPTQPAPTQPRATPEGFVDGNTRLAEIKRRRGQGN